MKKLITLSLALTLLFSNSNASTVNGMADAISQTAETIENERHVHQITVNEPTIAGKIIKGIAGVILFFWIGHVAVSLVD